MHYSSIINGKKSNLVFLHGWGGCWQSWYPILEKVKNEFNLYAIDLPGFGQEPIQIPYHLDNYVDFVIDFITKNKIKNPILIGHSFGGAIASKIAINQPKLITKIILVDAAPIRYDLTLKQKTISSIVKPIKTILSLPFIDRIYQPTKKLLYKSLKLENSGYADLTNPILKKTFTNVIREDLSSILPKIKIPTLIIWGEKDIDTPLSAGQKVHQLINRSQFIIYPKSSHFAYLEKPNEFTKDLIKFINQ